MDIKIQKKFIRTSPDKIRPIINLIRGWNAQQAINQLVFVNKHATKPVVEVIKSSLASAKDKDLDQEKIIIKSIICNEGPRLKRRRIIHRGRATSINKRMSHIVLVISDESKKAQIDSAKNSVIKKASSKKTEQSNSKSVKNK